MSLRAGVRRLFRLPIRSAASAHADVDEELEALIASRVEYLVARGMGPAAARQEALARVGLSLEQAHRQLHHSAERREQRMRFNDFIESLMQDAHYAARGLVRRPGFTAVAVLTLAIGVGATTAIFSVVNTLLLRPLPYARPDELMRVSLTTPARSNGSPGRDDMVWSYPKFVVFRDAQHVFSALALYTYSQATLGGDQPERDGIEQVGATYLRTLGLTPALGRDFDPAIDAHAGAPLEAIISYALWQSRYNADPAVVGKTLDLNQSGARVDRYTIIGVAPRDFQGLTGLARLFIPLTALSQADLWQPWSHGYTLVARRGPGVSAAQAEAATIALGKRVNEVYADPFGKAAWGAAAAPLDDTRLAPAVRRSLLVLFGAVGLVLLIACVNVANLLLGRASAREREIAVRVAIGAGRGRLVRLFLTESALLAALGATVSFAIAWLGVRWLGMLNPANTLRVSHDNSIGVVTLAPIALNWQALGFALGVSLLVGAVFGLAPAVGHRQALASALKGERSSRATGAGRRGLVVTEVALALMLLAGSGLMIRSLAKLLSIAPGFRAADVVTMRLTVAPTAGPGAAWRDSMPNFYAQLLDHVRAVPGVSDAAISDCPPLSGGCNGTLLERLDRPKLGPGRAPLVGVHWVSPTWFATMGVPLERGRVFTDVDRIGQPKVAIVNEQAARKIWPGEDPIGKHVEIGQGGYDDAEVVGIVGGVRQKPDSEPNPEAYVAYAQSPRTGMVVFVKSRRDLASLERDVRRAIHDVTAATPVYDIQTMEQRAAGATAQARFRAMLLTLFAVTALTLAAVGIYGVMALAVTARTRELGIRLALGAERGRVHRLVIGEGLGLVSLGALIGLAGALATTRVLRSFLFDLSPSDPVTYVAIVVVLTGVAVLASWVPARRAAAVDPVTALRAE